MRLTEFLDKGASLGAEAPCLTTAGRTLSYFDVQRLSWRFARALDRSGIEPGDRVIGIASSGIHSNGMTLTRRVFFAMARAKIDTYFSELGCTIGEDLLRPTIIYVPEILEVLAKGLSVKALIHVTGDGLLNLPRVDAKVGFVIEDLPPPPPLFGLIEKLGGVSRAERRNNPRSRATSSSRLNGLVM